MDRLNCVWCIGPNKNIHSILFPSHSACILSNTNSLSALKPDLVLEGLVQLIPYLDDILEKDAKYFQETHGGHSKRDILLNGIEKSLKGNFESEEKSQEIFQFLLMNGLVDKRLLNSPHWDNRTATEIFFDDLLSDRVNPGLRDRALDFGDPDRAVDGVMEYVNAKRSTVVVDGQSEERLTPIQIDSKTREEFKMFLSKLDYGRVLRRDGTKTHTQDSAFDIGSYLTDGHNSLICIM